MMRRKKTQRKQDPAKIIRQRTLAGPGNFFITVTDTGIRMPFPTGTYISAVHNERFMLTKRDWRTLIFHRDKFGAVVCKHYSNTMMFYGQLMVKEKGIRLGRYQLCPEETNENYITFKYDQSWI